MPIDSMYSQRTLRRLKECTVYGETRSYNIFLVFVTFCKRYQ